MIKIEIAKLVIEINNRYKYLEHQCSGFLSSSDKVDFSVIVTEEAIENEQKDLEFDYPKGYIESICCYRLICNQLPRYEAFLLHGAVVAVDGIAYAFCAKSGTGKTTHVRLWERLLGDRFSYINGDKPIIRLIDGKVYAFGTPWCGKENYGTNAYAPLGALCFLKRGVTNTIEDLPNNQLFPLLVHQILLPKDEENLDLVFNLLDATLKKVPTYLLSCNMELDAAKLSYNYMKKGQH